MRLRLSKNYDLSLTGIWATCQAPLAFVGVVVGYLFTVTIGGFFLGLKAGWNIANDHLEDA